MALQNKVLAIIQARYNSTRLPGKILKKINNLTILEILIKRLLKSNNISKIIEESHPKQEKKNLKKKLDTITMDDIIAMRNTISEEAKQEQGKDDLPPTDPNFV